MDSAEPGCTRRFPVVCLNSGPICESAVVRGPESGAASETIELAGGFPRRVNRTTGKRLNKVLALFLHAYSHTACVVHRYAEADVFSSGSPESFRQRSTAPMPVHSLNGGGRGRRWIGCDWFHCDMALWLVLASVKGAGQGSLYSAKGGCCEDRCCGAESARHWSPVLWTTRMTPVTGRLTATRVRSSVSFYSVLCGEGGAEPS